MSAPPPAASPAAPPLPPAHSLARGLWLAALLVDGVRSGGRSASALLPELAARHALDARDRGLLQALAMNALRQLGAAQTLRAKLVPRAPRPTVLAALLDVALSLLPWVAPSSAADLPAYAPPTLVDQAVRAARSQPALAHGAGLVNACLRRALREAEELAPWLQAQPLARWAHPSWWVDQLRREYPQQWEDMLAAAQRPAPMCLRVNALQGDAASYLQRLRAAGLEAAAVDGLPGAIRLAAPVAVERLPGFFDGAASVQDLGAQLAARLLAPRAGERVLDACAAPGGKSAHMLEQAAVELWALDSDAERLARVGATFDRLRLTEPRALPQPPRLICADAAAVQTWWDGRAFDAILLDAPCSASGIVRRHPDIRWLRRKDDVAALARQQQRLLEALWPLLAPGGRLLYCTCSVFGEEGRQQVAAFLACHADAQADDLDAALQRTLPGLRLRLASHARAGSSPPAGPGLQLLPGLAPCDAPVAESMQDHDGFYYALLRRRSAGP